MERPSQLVTSNRDSADQYADACHDRQRRRAVIVAVSSSRLG
jgi:hypothetical protein